MRKYCDELCLFIVGFPLQWFIYTTITMVLQLFKIKLNTELVPNCWCKVNSILKRSVVAEHFSGSVTSLITVHYLTDVPMSAFTWAARFWQPLNSPQLATHRYFANLLQRSLTDCSQLKHSAVRRRKEKGKSETAWLAVHTASIFSLGSASESDSSGPVSWYILVCFVLFRITNYTECVTTLL